MASRPDLDDDLDTGFNADDEFAYAGAEASVGMAPDSGTDLGGFTVAEDTAGVAAAGRQTVHAAGEAHLKAEAGAAEPSIPRIAIHFFCEKAPTAALADKAIRDRRLSRAATTVRPGGLAAAVEHYQNEPTPSLVVVESSDPKEVMLGLLDQLAEVCDAGTKVIVIGAANDIALYRELMRRGVSE